jgi:hypothetical protein
MRAVKRVSAAVEVLRYLKADIESAWTNYAERPQPAKDVETSIETALVDLERCLKVEAPALDKITGGMVPMSRADVVRETFDRR